MSYLSPNNFRLNLNSLNSKITIKDFDNKKTSKINDLIHVYYDKDVKQYFPDLIKKSDLTNNNNNNNDNSEYLLIWVDVTDFNIEWEFHLIDFPKSNSVKIKSNISVNNDMKTTPSSISSIFDIIDMINHNNDIQKKSVNIGAQINSTEYGTIEDYKKEKAFVNVTDKNKFWYVYSGPKEVLVQIDSGNLLATQTKSYILNETLNDLSFLAQQTFNLLNKSNKESIVSTYKTKDIKNNPIIFLAKTSNIKDKPYAAKMIITYIGVILNKSITKNIIPENFKYIK